MCNGVSLRSERGMSLAVVMIGVAISGIVAMGVVSWEKQKVAAKPRINVQATAEQIKQKLIGAVISPDSWQLTQSYNSAAFTTVTSLSSAPISGGTGTSSHLTQGQQSSMTATSSTSSTADTNLTTTEVAYPSLDIHLAGQSPSLFYSPSSTAGFNMQGEPCNAYDDSAGNDECPFHYNIQLVKHILQNGNWIDTLRFTLSYRPASLNASLNTAQSLYSFDIDRNFNEKSVETSCISIGGTFNAATGECSSKITPIVDCTTTTARAYIGPHLASGTSHCQTAQIAATPCGSHQAISGFTSGGSPQCVSL